MILVVDMWCLKNAWSDDVKSGHFPKRKTVEGWSFDTYCRDTCEKHVLSSFVPPSIERRPQTQTNCYYTWRLPPAQQQWQRWFGNTKLWDIIHPVSKVEEDFISEGVHKDFTRFPFAKKLWSCEMSESVQSENRENKKWIRTFFPSFTTSWGVEQRPTSFASLCLWWLRLTLDTDS